MATKQKKKLSLFNQLLALSLCAATVLTPILGVVKQEETQAFTYGSYSGWSESKPASIFGRNIEQGTKYKYRDKEFKTTSNANESGWTPTGAQYDGTPTAWAYYKAHTYDVCSNPGANQITGYGGVSNNVPTEELRNEAGYWYTSTQSGLGDAWSSIPGGYTVCGKTVKYKYGVRNSNSILTVWDRHYYRRTVPRTYQHWKWGSWKESINSNPGANANREIQKVTVWRYRDVLDTTAPTATCTTTDLNRDYYTIRCNAADENSGINRVEYHSWYENGGYDFKKTVNGTLISQSINSDGVASKATYEHTIKRSDFDNRFDFYNTHIFVYDNLGNFTKYTFRHDLRDTTPPTATLQLSNTSWTNKNVTATITGYDDTGGSGLSLLQYRSNGSAWQGVSNGATITLSTEGIHNIEARAQDASGNWSSIVAATAKIDKTVPTITDAYTTPNSWTKDSVKLFVATNDTGGSDVAKIQTNISNQGWIDHLGSTIDKEFLTQHGKYDIRIRTVDNAGNISTTSTIYAYIDKNAPSLTLEQEITDLTTKPYNIKIKAADGKNESGLQYIQLHSGNRVYDPETDYFISENGTYTFKAIDNVGNETTSSITVDNIKPIQDGTESPVNLFYKLDGDSSTSNQWVAVENGGKVWITNEGETNLTAKAIDEAGNNSSVKTTIVRIDLTRPEIAASHDTTWTNQNVTVNATVTDNIGVANVNSYQSSINRKMLLNTTSPTINKNILLISNSNITQDNGYYPEFSKIIPSLSTFGYTVTHLSDNDVPESLNTDGYDGIIYAGYVWGPSEKVSKIINKAYNDGKSILTFGNDSATTLQIIKGTESFTGKYTFNTTSNNTFLEEISNEASTSDNYQRITNVSENTKVIANIIHEDGLTTPGIIYDSNSNNGNWLHIQSSNEVASSNFIPNLIAETLQNKVNPPKAMTHSFTVTENGNYPITAYDLAGNKMTIVHNVSNIDREKPITIINTSPGCWTNEDVTVTISATDTESKINRIHYQLNGATTSNQMVHYGNSLTLKLSNNGETTITAYSYDNAGNRSDIVTSTACIDKLKPLVSSLTATPVLTKNSNVELNLVGSDSLSGLGLKQIKRNNEPWGSWTPYNSSNTKINTTLTIEGENTFSGRLQDNATNVSNISTVKVIYDITGPEITKAEVIPYYTNKGSVKIKATAKDNFEEQGWTKVESFFISNDNTNWTEFPTTDGEIEIDWSIPLNNGYQNIYIKAKDNVEDGNIGQTKTIEYVVDTIPPTGSIVIDNDQDIITTDEVTIHIKVEDVLNGIPNLSGVETIKIFDVNGNNSYTLTDPEENEMELDWILKPYGPDYHNQKAQIGIEITDKAGNVTTVLSKEVSVIKLYIDDFHLTNVINPSIYNSSNPFVKLTYPNIPVQPMLAGGSFSFEVDYSHPPLSAITGWTAMYEANIYYIGPDGFEETYPISKEGQTINGLFDALHEIPFHIPKDTNVYIDVTIKMFDKNGKFKGSDTFPKPIGTKLLIGQIEGDIREIIRFNEKS